MSDQDTPPMPAGYKDQRTSLKLLGICFVVQGILLGLLTLLTLMLAISPPRVLVSSGGPEAALYLSGMRYAAAACLVYALISLWVGRGSYRAARWACKVLSDTGVLMTVYGVVSILAMLAAYYPLLLGETSVLQGTAMPFGQLMVFMALSMLLIMMVFLAIPLTLWWYYRRPSVVATCEMHDPGRDWTAQCPRPLLVLVIVYAAYASMLVGLIVSGGPVPVGSTVLSGLGASLLGLVLTAWFLLLAYGTFKAQGWAAVAGCATAVILAAQQFFMDQEALMATFTQDPSAQAYMMEGMNVQASNMVSGVLIATFLIGYTVYHRNSFGSQQAVEHS